MSSQDKFAFNQLLIYAPSNYGSHPDKFARMAAELIEDVAAANPDQDPHPTDMMQIVYFGGRVRKRIFGIEWPLREGYKIPDGFMKFDRPPTDDFNHL